MGTVWPKDETQFTYQLKFGFWPKPNSKPSFSFRSFTVKTKNLNRGNNIKKTWFSSLCPCCIGVALKSLLPRFNMGHGRKQIWHESTRLWWIFVWFLFNTEETTLLLCSLMQILMCYRKRIVPNRSILQVESSERWLSLV